MNIHTVTRNKDMGVYVCIYIHGIYTCDSQTKRIQRDPLRGMQQIYVCIYIIHVTRDPYVSKETHYVCEPYGSKETHYVACNEYVGVYKYIRRIHVTRDPYISKETCYVTRMWIEIDPYM